METFYDKFVSSDPKIGPYFANTDMTKQKKLLAQSLIHVLNFSAGDPGSRQMIGMLSETHRKGRIGVTPDLYGFWEESLIGALREHDPSWNDQLESQWRSQLQPAIQQMISRSGATAVAAAV